MMKILVYVRVLLALILLFTVSFSGFFTIPNAIACSKGHVNTLEEDYLVANAIYTGTVTQLDEIYLNGRLMKQMTLNFDNVYKGKPQTTLVTSFDSDQCGVDVKIGSRYLFYASGKHHLYTSVFTTFDMIRSKESERISWLEKRAANAPIIHVLGEQKITAYVASRLNLAFDGKPALLSSPALIYNNVTYVPLDFLSHSLKLQTHWNPQEATIDISTSKGNEVESETSNWQSSPANAINAPTHLLIKYQNIHFIVNGSKYQPNEEPFILHKQVYIPLRALAEKLGLEVFWAQDLTSVDHPFPNGEKPPVLELKFSVNFGMEADYIVDTLTKTSVTYRYFDYQHTKKPETKQQTSSFESMLKMVEGQGIPANRVRLFLKDASQEVELKIAGNLMKAIESDPSYRQKLGSLLGKPISLSNKDTLLITLTDLQK
ncbi:hypothetical protein EHS13_04250 [Paenibacillus psychroresistens]|uniref:Copper amine oxidase-like N-terminal domain-containing protein n=1 Tax=Paenibacillus psychroresistens TaxID=1778678 RepID=A0A6B8RF73_9BACL|nr:stalk domain-containing protein [Paenibacillus psychroresistens]QGQ94173.1 hypothetical protein EHS13_04250 [Paenibacillus psychroresistens]